MGHLAYETDGSGTVLASFTYDAGGTPTSVTVGSNPTTAPRYTYVYNGHGAVVNLVDASGTQVATCSSGWANTPAAAAVCTSGASTRSTCLR